MRHARFAVVLIVLLGCCCSMAHAAAQKTLRIMFIGNSLTYVNNLPAVVTSLAAANGRAVQTAMLVRGGATLTQWLDSGAVPRALAAAHYDYVVLQERGNDFACGFGPQACKDARHALHALARIARDHGARPVLIGTYQVGHDASEALVAAESKAAGANDVPYIDVSRPLNAGRERIPFMVRRRPRRRWRCGPRCSCPAASSRRRIRSRNRCHRTSRWRVATTIRATTCSRPSHSRPTTDAISHCGLLRRNQTRRGFRLFCTMSRGGMVRQTRGALHAPPIPSFKEAR